MGKAYGLFEWHWESWWLFSLNYAGKPVGEIGVAGDEWGVRGGTQNLKQVFYLCHPDAP